MSEWAETLSGFTKFIFKQMLKVSSFYLQKQKSFIPKINIVLAVVSKHAKIIPKDGASRPNFQWRFWFSSEKLSLIKKKVYTCTNCKVHFHSSKLVFNFRSLIFLSKSQQGRRKSWKIGGRGQKVIKGYFDGFDFAAQSAQIWRGWIFPLPPISTDSVSKERETWYIFCSSWRKKFENRGLL